MAERQDLAVRNVLDVVRKRLQLAVVLERHAERVLGLFLDLVDTSVQRLEPALDLAAMPAEPVLELEVTRGVRVGELVTHHDEVARLTVEGVARRVRPSMLHRLEHLRHVLADRMLAVPVDDPRYSAHRRVPSPLFLDRRPYGRTSRYSFTSHSVTSAQ